MRASAPALERPSDEVHPTDLLALEFPALAAISSASVVGRVATGDHAGARLVRIGRDPDAAWVVSSSGPRQAHLDGFDLHANVAVPAGDPERLEHLLRYVLRPPVAQRWPACAHLPPHADAREPGTRNSLRPPLCAPYTGAGQGRRGQFNIR